MLFIENFILFIHKNVLKHDENEIAGLFFLIVGFKNYNA